MKKQMTIELSNEYPGSGGYYYAELELPAEEYEFRDVLQRIRATGRESRNPDISILDCNLLPQLSDVRLDSPTLDELNFFAKRLSALGLEEELVLCAVIDRIIPENYEGELVSMKDLINTTYGLDTIMIAANVGNDEQLGQFVIENDLHQDVASVPENALYLLDKKQIGKLQREMEGGIFVGDFYVVAGEYEMPEVYDGKSLPYEEPTEWFAFRLKIAEAPVNSADETEGSAEWISLPIDKSEANRIAGLHNEGCIEDCVYFDFESSVPQITSERFGDMQDFDKLNRLAEKMVYLSPTDQIKFKAVLCAEQPSDLDCMHDIIDHLWQYQITAKPDDADAFFKQYLAQHMDTKFDSKWLDTLLTRNEGERLLNRLGASCTPYGVISARRHTLYEPVSYDEPEVKELTTQALTDEKLEVVEVLGQTALFTNGRVTEQELPEGLYRYDLREGENLAFATIEPNVMVNHAGTVLMKAPLDFDGQEYIVLDDETSPNFLGYDMTPEEFMDTDFTQTEDEQEESQQMGGM